jgi:hypothetical protein
LETAPPVEPLEDAAAATTDDEDDKKVEGEIPEHDEL